MGDTDGCMPAVLKRFTTAFWDQWCLEVTKAGEQHAEFGNQMMEEIAYLVCKATSVNYCLSEVITYLQRSLHKTDPLSIETYDSEEGTALLEYGIHPNPERDELNFELRWRRPGQITCVDCETGDRSLWGGLKSVKGSFPIPPGALCHPQFQVTFERHGTSRLVNFAARTFGASPRASRSLSRSLSRDEVGYCSSTTPLHDQSCFDSACHGSMPTQTTQSAYPSGATTITQSASTGIAHHTSSISGNRFLADRPLLSNGRRSEVL